MVAFGADVSRQSAPVREAYAEGLRRYLAAFTRAYAAERGGRRAAADLRLEAIAHFATMVGAASLARSVAKADPALSEDILEAALAGLAKPETKRRRSPKTAT
jgi:TetR/AcrR family transcriptional repressor of nem operon